MNLILVRHGETDWNCEGRIHGQSGPGLNANGETEILALAEKLTKLKPDRIVSSDLRRATQSAAILVSVLRIPLHFDSRLRECSFGTLEGTLKSEVKSRLGMDWPDDTGAYDFHNVGGENLDEVLARHLSLIQDLETRYPKETVILMGHRRGLSTLLGIIEPGAIIERGEYRMLDPRLLRAALPRN